MNVFFLVLEILLIIAAIILQIVSFSRTKQGMEIFAAKVKDALSDAKLKSMKFLRDDLTDSKNVQSLIYCKDYLSELLAIIKQWQAWEIYYAFIKNNGNNTYFFNNKRRLD